MPWPGVRVASAARGLVGMDAAVEAADLELVEAAAAGRAPDGRIVTAVNVFHFTGGPCAELVLLGAAAAQGVYELVAVVAVGDGGRGVMPPCGRCRQVLSDCCPSVRVVVGAPGGVRTVPVAELLPMSYVWADQQQDG